MLSITLLPTVLVVLKSAQTCQAAFYVDWVNPTTLASMPLGGSDLQAARDQIFQQASYYSSLQMWGGAGCFCAASDEDSSTEVYQSGSGNNNNAASEQSYPNSNSSDATYSGASNDDSNAESGNQTEPPSNSTMTDDGAPSSNATQVDSGTPSNSTSPDGTADDDGNTYNNSTDGGARSSRTFGPSPANISSSDAQPRPTSAVGAIVPPGNQNSLDPNLIIAGVAGTDVPTSTEQVCRDFEIVLTNTANAAWYNAMAAGLSPVTDAANGYAQSAVSAVSALTVGEGHLTPTCLVSQVLSNYSPDILQNALGGVVVLANAVTILRNGDMSAWTPALSDAVATWATEIAQKVDVLSGQAISADVAGPWYTLGRSSLAMIAGNTSQVGSMLDTHFATPETPSSANTPSADLIDLQGQIVMAKLGESLGKTYWSSSIGPNGNISSTLAHVLGNALMVKDTSSTSAVLAPILAIVSSIYGAGPYLDFLKAMSPGYQQQVWWFLNQPASVKGAAPTATASRKSLDRKRDDAEAASSGVPVLQSTSTVSSTTEQVYSTSAQPIPPSTPTTTIETSTASSSTGRAQRRYLAPAGTPFRVHRRSDATGQATSTSASTDQLLPPQTTTSSSSDYQATAVYTTSAPAVSPDAPPSSWRVDSSTTQASPSKATNAEESGHSTGAGSSSGHSMMRKRRLSRSDTVDVATEQSVADSQPQRRQVRQGSSSKVMGSVHRRTFIL